MAKEYIYLDRCPYCSFQPTSDSDYCDEHRPKRCKHSKGTTSTYENGKWKFTCRRCGLNLACHRCGRSKLLSSRKCDHRNG